MAVKTITVTENAYEALKSLKAPSESFSEAITRITGKTSLKKFVGALSDESAKRLEEAVKEIRRRHTESYRRTLKKVVAAFERR